MISAEKYAAMDCLRALANVGYNLSTFPSMLLLALNEGRSHDVAGDCARIARNNQNDVVNSKWIS